MEGVDRKMAALEHYSRIRAWGMPFSFLFLGVTILIDGLLNDARTILFSAVLIIVISVSLLVGKWLATMMSGNTIDFGRSRPPNAVI